MPAREVIARSVWGARAPRDKSTVVWRRPVGWVHHTDNENDISASASTARERQAMRNIQNFHMGPSRGWSDIGYNYVIFPSGRIYEGRGKNVQGAHAEGENGEPGISFYGRFNSQLPTDEALAALGWLIKELEIRALKGHRDANDTDCPGNALYKRIQKPLSSFGSGAGSSGGSGDSGGDGGDSGGSSSSGPSSYAAQFATGYKSNEVVRQFPMDSDDSIVIVSEDYYNTLNPFFNKAEGSDYVDSYFAGGEYDLKNRCLFEYDYISPNENKAQTRKLGLIVPPNNITWSYSLRTKIENTYGGQVIQILGVQIDNFKLKGYIPTGFWGEEWKERWNPETNKKESYIDNNYISNPTQPQYYLETDSPQDRYRNGLVHVANFFRDFFAQKTQEGFSINNMKFHYPHYNWTDNNTIKLIPTSFPRVRISNDEILPEWELECTVVEHLSSHFVSQVSNKGLSQLRSRTFKDEIGFFEFIQWSDFSATTDISISEQAKNLGASIATFLTKFNPQESESLAQAGFSYPTEITETTLIKRKEQIIQDRFGENVVRE